MLVKGRLLAVGPHPRQQGLLSPVQIVSCTKRDCTQTCGMPTGVPRRAGGAHRSRWSAAQTGTSTRCHGQRRLPLPHRCRCRRGSGSTASPGPALQLPPGLSALRKPPGCLRCRAQPGAGPAREQLIHELKCMESCLLAATDLRAASEMVPHLIHSQLAP